MSMSKFNPGDVVICVKSSPTDQPYPVTQGDTYKIAHTMGLTVQPEGFPEHAWYNEDRFAAYEYLPPSEVTYSPIDIGEVSVDRVDEMIKERAGQWGDAATTHARIGDVWSGILGIDVSARQVALCMAGLKLVRAEINPGNEDSYVDGHAYLKFAEDFGQGV